MIFAYILNTTVLIEAGAFLVVATLLLSHELRIRRMEKARRSTLQFFRGVLGMGPTRGAAPRPMDLPRQP